PGHIVCSDFCRKSKFVCYLIGRPNGVNQSAKYANANARNACNLSTSTPPNTAVIAMAKTTKGWRDMA
ncbi:MAG: hypothetical protein AAF961_10050, partial [Planctomycetota bacterium]